MAYNTPFPAELHPGVLLVVCYFYFMECLRNESLDFFKLKAYMYKHTITCIIITKYSTIILITLMANTESLVDYRL